MTREPKPALNRYGVAVLLTAIAIAVRLRLTSVLGTDVPFILFFPTVTLCAWYGGFGPGLVATALSALAALFLYIEPLHSLSLSNPRDIIPLALFISGSSFMSWICGSLRSLLLSREEALDAERAARREIEVKQKRIASILESMTDGFVAIDKNWCYSYLNSRAEQILGKTMTEVVGQNVWDIFPEGKDTRFYTEAVRAISEHVTVSYEEFLPSIGKWLAVRLYPTPDGGHAAYFIDVTERRQAEAVLQDSEARYKALFETTQDGIMIVNDEGRYIEVNESLCRFLKTTREHLIGAHFSQFIPPEVLAEAEKDFNELKTFSAFSGEFPMRAVDGSIIELDWTSRANFSPGLHFCVARNITQRKQAEKEKAQLAAQVERQRKHLAQMVSNVPGVVWEAWGEPDAENQRIDFVSDFVEKMLGYTVTEWLSTPNFWLTIVHDEDKERAAKEAASIFNSGQVGISRFRWVAKDGRVVWVEARSSVMLDEKGTPLGMRGVTMDISERMQKEANDKFLAEATTMLTSSLIVETTLSTLAQLAVPHFSDWCAIDLADEQGKLNRLAVAHVDQEKVAWGHELNKRYPAEPSEPRGLYQVFRTGVSEFYPEIADELLVQSARDEEHLSIMRQIGFRSAMLIPLKTRDQILGVMTFVNSDSGRHHTEEDLVLAEDLARRAALAVDNARLYEREQRLRTEAESANRLKDEFLATISHELRTPLTAILGWSRMLQSGNLDQHTAERALATIERNATSQHQLIEDLLDVSRIITGKLRLNVRPVDLAPVISAAIDALSFAAESKGVVLQTDLDPSAGPILGDPDRLQQIVWNLVSNAVKFTPRGGRIQVSLQSREANIEIVVNDTGAGINPQFLPHVFERFRQADGTTTRIHGGLGLGLAIVRHLVELHGGTVVASSAGEGQGSTFTVTIPMMVWREQPQFERWIHPNVVPGLTTPVDTPQRLDGLKVMVVDDEPDARDLLTTILTGYGAQVTAVGSTAEALREIAEMKPDILLSDIGMPEADGYDLIQKVRASEMGSSAGKLAAIALTAYAKVEDRIRTISAGYQAHVAKPVDPIELVTIVGSLARRDSLNESDEKEGLSHQETHSKS